VGVPLYRTAGLRSVSTGFGFSVDSLLSNVTFCIESEYAFFELIIGLGSDYFPLLWLACTAEILIADEQRLLHQGPLSSRKNGASGEQIRKSSPSGDGFARGDMAPRGARLSGRALQAQGVMLLSLP
jgi:hypothetical protein